ncbi:unnamed protein product [Chrysodeixis includens]|uniref:HTH psq-type domain-containing protein n=1 Tax=Chrysodeixis includens TaxID=689277 RepID=A0A9N8PYG3_CHRIL|nr:unnamed protein product [Chrysodeixis includens]
MERRKLLAVGISRTAIAIRLKLYLAPNRLLYKNRLQAGNRWFEELYFDEEEKKITRMSKIEFDNVERGKRTEAPLSIDKNRQRPARAAARSGEAARAFASGEARLDRPRICLARQPREAARSRLTVCQWSCKWRSVYNLMLTNFLVFPKKTCRFRNSVHIQRYLNLWALLTRVYKMESTDKKIRGNWTERQLKSAIESVKSKQMSQRQAAATFKIPRRTLRNPDCNQRHNEYEVFSFATPKKAHCPIYDQKTIVIDCLPRNIIC